MAKKYESRPDKGNIFPTGITDVEFRQFCIDYLLGSDWYVIGPLGQEQINECAISEILTKHSSRFRKEKRKHNRRKVIRMIKIKKHTEGDSRVAKELPSFGEFRVANLDHISDVRKLADFFSKELIKRVSRHDWTKTDEPYQSMFYRDLCAVLEHRMDFFDGEWSKVHYTQMERHHLNRHCPDDVNLFDVIEMICDCVSAGMARSGEVYPIDLPADVIQKAIANTTKLLIDQIEVED